jgi:hypothetical protein
MLFVAQNVSLADTSLDVGGLRRIIWEDDIIAFEAWISREPLSGRLAALKPSSFFWATEAACRMMSSKS